MGLLDFFKDIDLKDKVGDFWELIDDPVKATLGGLDKPRGAIWGGLSAVANDEGFNLEDIGQGVVGGFKRPEDYQPDTGNRLLDIGLSAALDPLTYIPAANLTKAKYLKPLAPVLAPIAGGKAGIGKRVGAELATNVAFRGGSEVGTELTKDTPLAGVGGILGGLAAGGVTASKVGGALSNKIPEGTQLPKMTDEDWQTYFENESPHIADSIPSTIKKYSFTSNIGSHESYSTLEEAQLARQAQKLPDTVRIHEIEVPNPFSPEFEYTEREIPIHIDQNTQFITRGQLVYLSKEQARFDADPQMQAVDRIWDENAVQYIEIKDPNVRDVLVKWEAMSDPTALRQAFIDKNDELLSSVYDFGGPIRAALHELNPDGYVILNRGETAILGGKYTPQFEEGQVVQSMSSIPSGAAVFTHHIDNPDLFIPNDKLIMKVKVPIDDILIPLRSNQYPDEHELLVMDRNKLDDTFFKNITGIEKPQPLEATYEVFDLRTGKTVSRFKTEAEAQQAVVPSPLSQKESLRLDELTNEIDDLNKELTSFDTDISEADWINLNDELSLKSSELRDLREKAATGNLEIRAVPRGTESVQSLRDIENLQAAARDILNQEANEVTLSSNILGFAAPQNSAAKAKLQNAKLKTVLNKIKVDSQEGQDFVDSVLKQTNMPPMEQIYLRNLLEQIKPGSKLEQLSLENLVRQLKPATKIEQKWVDSLKKSLNIMAPNPLVQSSLAQAELIPEGLTKQNAGDELVKSIVGGEPTVPTTRLKFSTISESTLERQYYTPPVSNKAIMEKYQNIITSKGIDKKVATQLESLSAKDRKDIADMMVNEQAARGIPEDMVRLIVQGYEKAGITDQAKIAKLNSLLRGMWATGDGSWFGIQGLLSIPRMLVKGDFKDAADTLFIPMAVLAGNKTIMTQHLNRLIENLPEGAPSLFQIHQGGLHLAFLKGNVDFNFTLFDKLPFFKPDEAFMAAGDIARVSMFYNEWLRYGAKGKGSIEQIAAAVNRATGIAETPFGGQIGSFALFAPRFFQSQLEIISKAFTDGSIEGILARRQLLTLIGTGTALTFAANYVRGEETILDPRDPNFLRIRNIAGSDISVFGPWDSLAKLIVHLGSGDLGYARTKFGPLASLMSNIITGETFIGDPVQSNPYNIAGEVINQAKQVAQGEFNITDMDAATNNTLKSLFLPFAWQEVGKEAPLSSALNFFGVKNSPLSRVETIDVNMTNLGLDPNDPLDRRQYIAEHPEYRPQATEVDKAAIDYRGDIQDRRQLNEDGTADDSLRLVEFRENRKSLSRELRAKLETLYRGRDDFKADTPQKRWVASYFDLFAQAQDPISHDIIGQEFDRLQAQWIEANGDAALDYVNRYLQIDKGDIELQYLNDMRELDKLGYFDTPKFDPYIYQLSGLTDKQIEDYRDRVSAARSVNPELAKRSFKQSLREILGGELTEDQIWAINKAGSESYANEEIARLKEIQPHLFQWFNPNATWSNYLEAKGESVELPSPVLAIPRIR